MMQLQRPACAACLQAGGAPLRCRQRQQLQRSQQRRQQPPRSTTATAAAAAAAPPADIDPEVYTDASKQPQPFVGPVKPALIAGKGRGLVATADCQPGQLLLVVPPLALVQGGLGEIPEHDELQEVIAASGALFSPWQADWLRALTQHTSSGHAADGTPQQEQQQQQDLPSMLPPPGQAAWSGSSSSDNNAATTAAEGRVPFSALGMSDEQLWAAIVLNCFGEQFQDLPASLCAGAPLSSHLGLFGPFSLLNHACAPNAVNYTLRDAMVVRAATRVTAGEEICINYLGRSALRPRSQRQAELQACYDFTCGCARCTAEAAWADEDAVPWLTERVERIYRDVGSLYEPALRDFTQEKQEEAAWLAAAAAAAVDGDDSSSSSSREDLERKVGIRRERREEHAWNVAAAMMSEWEALLDACTPSSGGPYSSSPASSRAAAAAAEQAAAAAAAAAGGGTGAAAPPAGPQGAATGAQQQQQQPRPDVVWAQASAFDFLSLYYEGVWEGVFDHPFMSVLDALVETCEAACPGSDLHLFQALRRTSIAQQQRQKQQEEGGGRDDDVEAENVEKHTFDGLRRALVVRYGPAVAADEALLARLVAATSQAAAMVAF